MTTILRLLGCVVVVGLTQCSQQQVGTPLNLPLRSYWREVYHTSSWTYRPAFDLAAVREVWQRNPVLAYDTFFVGNEYRGARDSCGIEPIVISTELSSSLYPLVEDSGWKFDEIPPEGGPSRPTLDTWRAFSEFYIPGDSIVPVFVIPRLITVRADGTFDWRRVYGFAYDGGDVFPSIWLNSREIEAGILFAPANRKPYSVLAHEMSHILLDPLNFPGRVVWDDDATAFLHIQTHFGTVRLLRRSTIGPGPTDPTAADDLNRRNLIVFGIDDACTLARIHLPFVRPVLP